MRSKTRTPDPEMAEAMLAEAALTDFAAFEKRKPDADRIYLRRLGLAGVV